MYNYEKDSWFVISHEFLRVPMTPVTLEQAVEQANRRWDKYRIHSHLLRYVNRHQQIQMRLRNITTEETIPLEALGL